MQPITNTVVALALFLAACDRSSPPAMEDDRPGLIDAAAIDTVLEGYVERGELVGVSALVYQNGSEAYFGAFGMADREAGRAMARDSVARIFSMTKPLTGVVLMTFFEEGRFALDDPLHEVPAGIRDVQVYVSGEGEDLVLEAPARPILVRDILRHTAGFGGTAYVDGQLNEVAPLSRENTFAELSVTLASVPLGYQPGTRWLYGPSVDVQARLVEVLAGKPYARVLQERLLGPLAMQDTHYVLGPGQDERLMELYERRPDGSFARSAERALADFNLEASPLTPGGWGLVSTLDDYMRFARMLQGGGALDGVRILEPDTIELMATDSLSGSVTDRSWLPKKGQVGFGIDFAVRVAPPANDAEASGAVGEFFWDGLANTLFWVDPRNDITAVLFNQYVPWGQTEIQKDFRDAVYRHDPAASATNKPAAGPDAPRLSD